MTESWQIAVLYASNSCILYYEDESTGDAALKALLLISSVTELGAIMFVSLKFVRKDKAHMVRGAVYAVH